MSVRANGTAPRLGYLDALRGVAALVVAAFFHYEGFVPPGSAVDRGTFPLATILPFRLAYSHGWLAVDLFFLLSGVVFAHTYARRVTDRAVGGREFFLLRFSRLYPVHVLTLIVTAVLVHTYHAKFGVFPFYAFNDVKHFVLNVLFLQSVGLEDGWSFNGPAWSLSVEAIMYALFYAACRSGQYRRLAPVLAAAGVIAAHQLSVPVMTVPLEMARGLGGFFLGSVLYDHVFDRPKVADRLLLALPLAAVALLKLGLLDIYALVWIIFAFVVVAVQRHAVLRNALAWRPLIVLGDISLSIYMVHIPIQAAMLLAWRSVAGWPPVTAWWFFSLYVAIVIGVASLTHYGFERPVQQMLRRRFRPSAPL